MYKYVHVWKFQVQEVMCTWLAGKLALVGIGSYADHICGIMLHMLFKFLNSKYNENVAFFVPKILLSQEHKNVIYCSYPLI